MKELKHREIRFAKDLTAYKQQAQSQTQTQRLCSQPRSGLLLMWLTNCASLYTNIDIRVEFEISY